MKQAKCVESAPPSQVSSNADWKSVLEVRTSRGLGLREEWRHPHAGYGDQRDLSRKADCVLGIQDVKRLVIAR